MKRNIALAVLTCLSLLGCGSDQADSADESLAKRAGSKAGEVLVDFTSGVGAGTDTKLMVPVDVGPALQAKRVTGTVAKSLGIGAARKGFSVYLISQDAFSGGLVAKAYDKSGAEIGRSQTEVEFVADDAKYITFEFEHEMDSNVVARYLVDLKAQAVAAERPL